MVVRSKKIPWKNTSGETMPAGAIFMITEYNSGGYYEADKWTGEFNFWGFNGQVDVAANGFGWFDSSQAEYIALVDSAPEWGRHVGPVSDEWALDSKSGGFRFYGETSDNLITGVRPVVGADTLMCSLDEDLATAEAVKDDRTSATATVMYWGSNRDLDTGSPTITVHNPFERIEFAEDDVIRVIWDAVEWHPIAADCPE